MPDNILKIKTNDESEISYLEDSKDIYYVNKDYNVWDDINNASSKEEAIQILNDLNFKIIDVSFIKKIKNLNIKDIKTIIDDKKYSLIKALNSNNPKLVSNVINSIISDRADGVGIISEYYFSNGASLSVAITNPK